MWNSTLAREGSKALGSRNGEAVAMWYLGRLWECRKITGLRRRNAGQTGRANCVADIRSPREPKRQA